MPHTDKQTTRFALGEFFLNMARAFVPSAYARLAAQPASSAALYLVGVAFVVTLLLTPLVYVDHARQLAVRRAHVEQALPDELYFEGGKADYEGEQPYVHIETLGEQRHAVLIDTTGATTEIAADYSSGFLVTRDRIIQRIITASGQSKTFDGPIPETEGRIRAKAFFLAAIDRERWPEFAFRVGNFFLWLVLPLFALAGLAAAVGAAIEATRKQDRVPFRTCFAVAAHAATPVAFFAASWLAVRTILQFYLVLGVPLVLFALLVTLGTQACRRSPEARPEAQRAS